MAEVWLQGAFWGLMSGCVTGVARMVVDFYYGEPACHEQDHRPVWLQEVSFGGSFLLSLEYSLAKGGTADNHNVSSLRIPLAPCLSLKMGLDMRCELSKLTNKRLPWGQAS